jgi:hypothetical protein
LGLTRIQEDSSEAYLKATIDIPDELYRQVKARSALEGRPLRLVAMELFQNWLAAPQAMAKSGSKSTDAETAAAAPWLTITRRYLKLSMTHDLETIRAAIATGRAGGSDGRNRSVRLRVQAIAS